MIKVIILSLLLLLTQYGNIYAASNKEKYELQERCGKRAGERFKQEYGNGTLSDNNGTTMVSYTNHYNNKLNKCFILLKSVYFPKNKKDSSLRTESLFDVNENKEYGSSILDGNDITQCKLLNSFCESEAQWILFVKPYMEE